MRTWGIALAALLTTAGCSAHEVDEAAWKADLAEVGVTPGHWRDFADIWHEQCADEEGLPYFVAVGLDEGNDPAIYRVSIEHACPDRLDDVEQLLG